MEEQVIQETPVASPEQPVAEQSDLSAQLEALKAQNFKLIGENRKSREGKEELQRKLDEFLNAQKEAKTEKMAESGEFKTLWEQAQSRLAEKDNELKEFTAKIQQKDIDSASAQIGARLAKSDTKRAEVLSDYASKYARHDGERVQFLIGGMEVDSAALMDHLKKEFPFLVDGSSATGGGASSSSSSGAAKQISRAEFDRMAPDRKMSFIKDGGAIED